MTPKEEGHTPPPRMILDCPSCGLPTEITDVARLSAAGGGTVVHLRISCITNRHHFFLPADMLPARKAHGESR